MDTQLKLIMKLVSKINSHIKIINEIIYEINNVVNENKVIGINIRNSINTLNEDNKKINFNDYNNINFENSPSLDVTSNYINEQMTVTFKKFGKEENYVYNSNTPLNKVLRNYLEDSGSLKMPKKPIFLFNGSSLNPNDKRKIKDITGDDLEITVDYF